MYIILGVHCSVLMIDFAYKYKSYKHNVSMKRIGLQCGKNKYIHNAPYLMCLLRNLFKAGKVRVPLKRMPSLFVLVNILMVGKVSM